jgi:tyrosyl-tRNA synthetase
MSNINSIFSELVARGMVESITNLDAISKLLAGKLVPIYIGFDPTADSLHVGNLLPIMLLAQLQRAGHIPIVVVGGATGSIGDPSGRTTERQLLSMEIIESNSKSIKRQLSKFLSFEGENAAIMVNNADWTKDVTILEFLRDIGKHFTVNYMLSKESVKRRMQEEDLGITVTEFLYMTLQAFDFLKLYQQHNCLIQAGGNDQLGNIIAGIDLIRRKCGGEVHGMTVPLIVTSSGEKFGKSAGNAVWLDAQKTSPYQFYQFWIQTDDKDVERYLKLFTFLSVAEIEQICNRHQSHPEQREAQKILASEVTTIVHGNEALERVLLATQVLFGGSIADLSDRDLTEIFHDVPSTNLSTSCLTGTFTIVDLLIAAGMCSSRGECRRLIDNKGVNLNNFLVTSSNLVVDRTYLISDSLLILRTGKKNYQLVRFDRELAAATAEIKMLKTGEKISVSLDCLTDELKQ